MRIVPVVSLETYILGKLIGYAIIIGLPIMLVISVVCFIVELIREAINAFLASAFYASMVETWNAIITFFDVYGWIFVLVFSIIGFITTVVVLYYGIKGLCMWIGDKIFDLKCAIRRRTSRRSGYIQYGDSFSRGGYNNYGSSF